jgi:hypothetical protein
MKSFAPIILGVIFFGGFGTLCIVWAVVTLGRGEYLTAITVLGFAGFCFSPVVASMIVKSGRVTARGTFDGAGTVIRQDRRVELLTLGFLFAGVIGMGLFAIFWPLGKLDIPVPHSFRYSLPFMSAAGAVMGGLGLWRALGRGERGYLRLTPQGFEISNASPSCGEWAQVKDVADRAPGKPVPAAKSIVMVMADGQTPTLAAGSYTPGGQALREMVRFYWQHPEHRAELADGRALTRLSSHTFKAD